ncbi:MAG: hypothetical protein ACT4O1_16400 [Gemmatimonadota bacterium]
MENEAWRHYFEDFRGRAERIPQDAFERNSLLYEAAHDAYQSGTDRLTSAGWDQDQALVMGRLFGTVVKGWVDRDGHVFEQLERDLKTHYEAWLKPE